MLTRPSAFCLHREIAVLSTEHHLSIFRSAAQGDDPRAGVGRWKQVQKLDPLQAPRHGEDRIGGPTLQSEDPRQQGVLKDMDFQISGEWQSSRSSYVRQVLCALTLPCDPNQAFEWLRVSDEVDVLVTGSRSGLLCFWM